MEEIFVKSRNIWNSCMQNVNMLFNNKLPTNLYTTFQVIKLLIKKGNLNLIHNKITYQISWIHAMKNNTKRNIHINIIYIKFHQSSTTYINILYTRNFLHENGKQILHNGEYQRRQTMKMKHIQYISYFIQIFYISNFHGYM